MRFKGITLRVLVYFSLFTTPQISEAKLNIRAGEYRWSYNFQIEELNLRITYSSRSTYTGLFGAGWCSSLDYEDTEVGLFHCGRRLRKPPDDLKKRLRLRAQLSVGLIPLRQVNGHIFRYKQNLLTEITSPTGDTWKFKYNSLTNLVSIVAPRKKLTSIHYDDNNDRVKKIEKGQCIENMNYKQSARKRWISYEKHCSGRLISAQYYEVTYALSSKGGTYIQQVKFKTPKRTTLIEYSEAGEILTINLTNRKEKT